MPSVFQFDTARAFLLKWKEEDPVRSYPWIGKRLGRVAGYAHRLFETRPGRRPARLAPYVPKLAAMIHLSPHEAEYLRLLVLGEEAPTEAERLRAVREAAAMRRPAEAGGVRPDDLPVLDHWYYYAIYELVQLPAARPDAEWLARTLWPSIDPAEAQRALDFLVERGHLVWEDGRLRGKHRDLHIEPGADPELYRDRMRAWHLWFVERARGAMLEIPTTERDFRALTVKVPSERYAEAIRLLHDCQNQILSLCEHDHAEPDSVYLLNMQFFPVTRRVRGSKGAPPKVR